MAANGPYYQMRAGQFINATNSTNAAQPQFVPEEDEYDLSASAAVIPSHEHLHPSMYSEHSARQTSADNTFEENHNFVELLEAATTAAGQATQAMHVDDVSTTSTAAQGKGKRKRASSSPIDDVAVTDEAFSGKRRRVDVPTDPQLQEGDRSMRGNSDTGSVPPTNESLLNDARAAGVHSAAALFRRSSERTSRKYTRPPMSKLFMSLQLSPERFLQLQARAKSYMLSSAHPERQNCVGNRGKGDTDMVKLRLFNCVRDFLDDKVGEEFFGEHVEKPGERDAIEAARALGEEKTAGPEARLTWPRDGNNIISLVTPLMRRMVTNERQRQYAIETRKGGAKKKEKEGSIEATSPQANSNSGHEIEQQLQSAFDPNLAQHIQFSQPASPSIPIAVMHNTPARYRKHPDHDRSTPEEVVAKASDTAHAKLPTSGPTEPNLSHINIFLVLAPQATKASIKLDEKRISVERPAHLAFYDWNDFVKEASELLKKAKAKYPELRQRLVLQEDHRIGVENLRGLAAAANALQTEEANVDGGVMTPGLALPRSRSVSHVSKPGIEGANPDASSSSSPPPRNPQPPSALEDNALRNSTDGARDKLIPRYVIKSLGHDGWKIISNEQEWYTMLREKAFAVWADGVCNVLVELVECHGRGTVEGLGEFPHTTEHTAGEKGKGR